MRRIEDDPEAGEYDEPFASSALDDPDLPVGAEDDDVQDSRDRPGEAATSGYDDDVQDSRGRPGEGATSGDDDDVQDSRGRLGEGATPGYDDGLVGDGVADYHDDLREGGYGGRYDDDDAEVAGRSGPAAYDGDPVGAPPEVGAYLPMLADASGPGPRRARLATQRRRRRTTIVALLSAGGVLLAVALLLPVLTRGQGQTSAAATADTPSTDAGPPVSSGPLVTRTVLLVGYGEEGGPARSTTLLTAASDGSAGSVVFLPAGLLLEIPGFGLDRLSQAQRFDGSDLVAETVESALGVAIDDFAALSESGLASLLDRVGEFSVFVGNEPLVAREEEGVSPLRIEAGQQDLSGEQMAVYFDLLAEGESPVDAFPRQQQVLTALLAKIADDPEVLDRVFTEGATEFEGTGDPDALREVLEALAAAQANEQLTYEGLPVETFGGPTEGTVTTYRTEADTSAFLDSLLPEPGSG